MSNDNGGAAFPAICRSINGVPLSPGMTMRQYAAIHLNVPESGCDWLDEMIIKSNKDDLATNAIQGFCANPSAMPQRQEHFDNMSQDAYRMADAMLKERNK